MRRIFGFASLTLLTQVVLMLQQVVLIPVQVHMWGADTTAQWYSALALAAITTVADLGLRNAGHAELISTIRNQDDISSREKFRQIWLWIRILVTAVTCGLIVVEYIGSLLYGSPIAPWRIALILAGGLESIFSIRIIYLDSLGLYNQAEVGYFLYSATRLALSFEALTAFTIGKSGLATIYFGSALLAVMLQGRTCRSHPMLHLFKGLSHIPSRSTLATARYTVAWPAANWVQLQLPVLVLSSIAPPPLVMIYVAFRAFFGIVRQTIHTLARAISVEYIRLVHDNSTKRAEIILSAVVVLCASLGAWLGIALLIGGETVLRMMAVQVELSQYRFIVLTFGIGTGFFSYQIIMQIMMRMGKVAEVALRQDVYIAIAGVISLIGLIMNTPMPYLMLATMAESALAAMFFFYRPDWHETQTVSSGLRGLPAALASAVIVFFVWYALDDDRPMIADDFSLMSVLRAVLVLASQIAVLTTVLVILNWDLHKILRHGSSKP